MPIPADRIARRLPLRAEAAAVHVIRALAHLHTPEQTQAPADRIARRR